MTVNKIDFKKICLKRSLQSIEKTDNKIGEGADNEMEQIKHRGYFKCVRENEREELWFQIVGGESLRR